MANFEIIDNFLEDAHFSSLSESLVSDYFPWFFNNHIVHKDGEEENLVEGKRMFQFTHTFIRDGQVNSPHCSILSQLIKKLEAKQLYRVKANLNTYSGESPIITAFHVDSGLNAPVKTAIFYINSNNGYTEFETGEKVMSRQNRLCLFDVNTRHRGVIQTDSKNRVLVNLVYL